MNRAIRAALAAGIAIVALAIGPPPAARACSCAQQTEQQHRDYADAVFTGMVTNVDKGSGQYPDPIVATIDTEATEKGSVADPQAITTAQDSAACGFYFEVGKRYRVFAKRDDSGHMSTGLCSGTTEVMGGPPSTVATTSTRPPPTTTTRRPAPTITTTTEATSSTTTSEPATTTSTSALAHRRTASDGGGGRGGLALAIAGGVAVLGLGAFAIRRFR